MKPGRSDGLPGRAADAFARRAGRAEALAPASESGAGPLAFAAGLYRAQGAVAAALEEAPLSGSLEADVEQFAGALADLIGYAVEAGPPGLAAEARARLGDTARLIEWWRDDRTGRGDYLARALLRPYAEVLAGRGVRPPPAAQAGESGCPFCTAPAWIGWRRIQVGESGAQRFLACGLCGGSWQYNRIRCAACGEEDPHKQAMFQSEKHPSVRLEACETCHHYVKSIDLTLDARAIAEVDDLSSLSMDLWAAEQGYTRLEPSNAGI